MGTRHELTADDGHRFAVYLAEPADRPRGGIVVLHEIFGVNRHIRAVCEGLAALGYRTIAPAFFDRIEPGVELAYTREDAQFARRTYSTVLDRGLALIDLAAAIRYVRPCGRVGLVGFSWGATTAWLAAAEALPDCIVAYYAAALRYPDARPRCPALLHLGKRDRRLKPGDVARLRADHPDVAIHTYPANHGFGCDDPDRGVYHAESARRAERRSRDFLHRHVG